MSKDIKLLVHPPLEFYYALVCLGAEENLMKSLEEEGIRPEGAYLDIRDELKKNISKYIWQELRYFFDKEINPIMGIGEVILWGFVLGNPKITRVDELIEFIEASSVEEFFANFVSFTFYENTNKRIKDVRDWEAIRQDIKLMTDEIKNIEFKNISRREIYIEALENAEETKHRYCLLLKQFYEKSYKNLEQRLLDISTSCIEQYEQILKKNPGRFLRDYFKKDIEVFSDKINIHLSYIWYCGSEYWASGEELEWLSLGSKTIDYIQEEPIKDRVINFLKKISDRKRIEIIELLSLRDCYVNEIADELKISAATASYHLATLQDFGIVDFERVEHRFYYHINKEKLKELLAEVKEVLIIENK